MPFLTPIKGFKHTLGMAAHWQTATSAITSLRSLHCRAHHVAEVGSLLVQLSKDAEYQANAPSCLQNVMANYGSHFTKSFAGLLHQLPPQERGQLISFLADVGSGSSHDYQGIIQNLKGLKEADLAKEFQQAQNERSKKSH